MNDWFDAEHHVERAHEAYEAGRWDEAESALRDALALNPYRAEWHFNLGLTLEAAGRPDDAVRAFRDAHSLEPRDYQTLFMLGTLSLRADEIKGAIAWLEAAQEVDPNRADTFIYRIEAYARLGDHEQAEMMFYRALQLEGDHALAYANIAESLMDREQNERAVSCLREAAALDPRLPRVHARLAAAYAATGRHERARQLFLRELRESPGDIDTLLDLGCLLVEMNRLAEASEKFRRVLEVDADNAEAHFHLGDIAERQHRSKEAAAAFGLVLKLDPEYPEVRRRLARLSIAQGELGGARRLLRAECRRLRHDPARFADKDLEEFGLLLLDVRLPREAGQVFESLVERRPEDARALHLYSVACFEAGERGAGMDACKKALRRDPRLLAALHNMALACVGEGQWGRARYYLEQGLAVDPDDHSLRRLRLTLRLHRVVEAMGWLRARQRARKTARAGS